MRSRKNVKVCSREVQEHCHELLTPVLLGRLGEGKGKCPLSVLLDTILTAAARMISLFAVCSQQGGVSDDTVRTHLRKRLPKRRQKLEAELNAALQEPLPKQAGRSARCVAIDLHDIPYHGEGQRENHLIHRKPKAGTTTFFTYATACLVLGGQRYTLAYTWVKQGETDIVVVQRLLAEIAKMGLKIRCLLLDRGFFNVALMSFLQGQNIPFVIPVVFRGRKPKPGKPYTGLRAFSRKKAGWYDHTHRWKSQEVTIKICVAYKSFRHHRSGCRRNKKLVFAVWKQTGTTTQIRELYRKRFAIETSYRQLGHARIRTSTSDPLMRSFFVGLALLLRNVWLAIRALLWGEEDPPTRPGAYLRFTFKRLLHALATLIETNGSIRPRLT
jgi:hypothetical protein